MEKYLLLHTIAFLLGVMLDRIIGDPHWCPHPIRLIGNMIYKLDHKFMPEGYVPQSDEKKEKRKGLLMVLIVVFSTFFVMAFLIVGAYLIHDIIGLVAEVIFTCYLLAARCLDHESSAVGKCLAKCDVEGARYAVSMIVGRDTDVLDEKGITKAAVETVAENTSDGVIAPLLYAFLGGPILGMTYKAVNTMDSMVGYHNDRYEYFGSSAARLDDVVNFLPARISAFVMCIGSAVLRIFSIYYHPVHAFRIWKRDRFNHKSPNSAQTESACAGALNLMLAGDAVYFGRLHKKPTIGDDIRPIEYKDVHRANMLMYLTEDLCVLVCMGILFLIYFLVIVR